jgi:hypothetical protein
MRTEIEVVFKATRTNGDPAFLCIKMTPWLVPKLKPLMLIGMDIIAPHDMSIFPGRQLVSVGSYDNAWVNIKIERKEWPVTKPKNEHPDTFMSLHPAVDENSPTLENGITVYGDDPTIAQLAEVVGRFPRLWVDKGTTVRVSDDRHLTVPLKDDWASTSFTTKPYPLSDKDRIIVDELFDKLHKDGKMKWSDEPTRFSALVFVVYKPALKDGKWVKKPRPVVDLRVLNSITVKDLYPLPLQEDILKRVRGKRFISVLDAT